MGRRQSPSAWTRQPPRPSTSGAYIRADPEHGTTTPPHAASSTSDARRWCTFCAHEAPKRREVPAVVHGASEALTCEDAHRRDRTRSTHRRLIDPDTEEVTGSIPVSPTRITAGHRPGAPFGRRAMILLCTSVWLAGVVDSIQQPCQCLVGVLEEVPVPVEGKRHARVACPGRDLLGVFSRRDTGSRQCSNVVE